MSELAGLDLAGRAALVGLSCREYVRLAEGDQRIVSDVALTAPVLRRWLDAGSPDADPSRLEFCGDDSVRAIVVDVLRRVPMPVAWSAVEHVVFVEVGRNALGWRGRMPVARAHMIALNGCLEDEVIANVVAHELGHHASCPITSIPPTVVRLSRAEYTARLVSIGVTHEELSREEAASEKLADDLAELWGFKRHHTGAIR